MSKEAMKLALEALDVLLTEPIAHKAADRAEYLLLQAAPAIRKALAEQPAQQEPVAWKLVPTKPTEEMLKAMDECSKEGYDERLYAGHAASVYMAAVDAAPTPPAQRKPLTDELLRKMHHEDQFGLFCDYDEFEQIARAIEAAIKSRRTHEDRN